MPVYCNFVLDYPTHAGATATFAPRNGALLTSTRWKFRSNAIVHEMFDPRVQHTYIKGGTFQERGYEFVLDTDEVAGYYTFWQAALGKSFELQDPFTGAGRILVRMASGSTEPELQIIAGTQGEYIWKSAMTFRDALS